jgi:Predicted transcriptional regulator containing an HTH domain and an uncharacterized domain shared with the mammalian protein Schlafen
MDWFMPNGKRFEDWEEAEVQYFIDEKIPEGKHLDYKAELHLETGDQRREFVADVSAFANTDGGYLVYGIAEGESKDPADLCGIDIIGTPDEIKLRILNIVRDTVQPRIAGIQIICFKLSNEKFALIIKIPASLFGPHRTSDRHFYVRTTAGKDSLDVHGIRSAFLQSETLRTASQNFRLDRLSQIMNNDTPIEFSSDSRMVIHLIPLASLRPNFSIDIESLLMNSGHGNFPGLGEPHSYANYTHDGIYSATASMPMYSKLFDSGIFETVSSYYFSPTSDILPSQCIEEDAIRFVQNGINFLMERIQLLEPIIISISFLNIKGKVLGTPWTIRGTQTPPIKTNHLLLPEILWSDVSPEPLSFGKTAQILYPLFKKWWNAFEHSKSMYFDGSGNWNSRY